MRGLTDKGIMSVQQKIMEVPVDQALNLVWFFFESQGQSCMMYRCVEFLLGAGFMDANGGRDTS